ncbi:winged helix-turn-helix domain-containing protein [Psychrosphaera haliotis]|uniref:OmpR/PhoB-type domain-containing protein n=1 Tax=Psychrosphaera haliotis TaxID=555083 RepID=A0A6N8F9W7_9GAMM|nr:hypothetical protein [Psychrosphaera haliotis]
MLLIADVTFDQGQRKLIKGELSRSLEPKVFSLLVLLISKKSQIVTRDELIAEVWKNRIVGEGAINRTVSLLRAHFLALTKIDIIETVPTQGYRLVANLDEYTVSQPSDVNKTAQSKKRFRYSFPFVFLTLLVVAFLTTVIFLQKNESVDKAPMASLELLDGPLVGLSGWEYGLSSTIDGSTLLFHHVGSDSMDGTDSVQRVYLYSTEHHTKESILESSISAISPSGEHVIYVNYEAQQCTFSLYTVASKRSESLIPCDEPPSHLIWGSNNTFYFNKRLSKSHPYQVFSFNLDTSQITQITNPNSANNTRGDFNFSFSNVSKMLSVVRYLDEQASQIILFKNNIQVAEFDVSLGIKSSAWHPTKNQLLMADTSNIYLLDSNTGVYTKIKQLNLDVKSLATAYSNGKPLLLVGNAHVKSSVIKQHLADGYREVWQKSGQTEMLPRVKGNTHLVLSTRYKNHQWWQVNKGDASIIKAELPFDLKFVRYEISSDENYILFTKNGVVYELDIETGQLTTLFDDHEHSYVVNYDTNNQQSLIYSGNQSGQWQLWQYDRDTNTHTKLTKNGGYSGYVVGEYLYYSKYTTDGLWRKKRSLNNEQEAAEELLIKDFSRVNWLNWQVIDTNIYFYRKASGVWRYSLDAKTEELIFQAPANFVHQYTISPDQKSIYWVKLEPVEGDIFQYAID